MAVVRIQLRRDTSANWTSVNPILAQGEIGLETDTSKIKIGNGTTSWTLLEYFGIVRSDLDKKQDTFQYAVMPEITSADVGKIAQYIGATTSQFTNGYFYIAEFDNITGTYKWVAKPVQQGGGGGGGYEPDTDKGLEVIDDKLAVKVDNTTTQFDANGKLKAIGSVSSVNTKTGVVVLKAEDIDANNSQTIQNNLERIDERIDELESVIIGATESETIQGFSVPKLSNEEITQAYNGIVAGKKVIITNSADTLNMSVVSADNISEDITITAIYTDKLVLSYKVDESSATEMGIVSGIKIGEQLVDIGSNSYVYDSYTLPAISKTNLDKIYANKSNGIAQYLKWTYMGSETYLSVVSADKISGSYSIDVLIHNKYHCSYTWQDSTTGNVNPEVKDSYTKSETYSKTEIDTELKKKVMAINSTLDTSSYATREALITEWWASGKATGFFYGTFTTASENPTGITTYQGRWQMMVNIFNYGQYATIVAINRGETTDMYYCNCLYNTSTSTRVWSAWQKVATGEVVSGNFSSSPLTNRTRALIHSATSIHHIYWETNVRFTAEDVPTGTTTTTIFAVECYKYSNTFGWIRAQAANGTTIFISVLSAGTWTAWKKLEAV